jgi:hemerythrin
MLWNDRFAFNITEVDEQHKQLFYLIDQVNTLEKDVKEGIDCYDEVYAVLKELEDYTVYHFEEEEKLLESSGYIDLEAHQKEHDAFVLKVKETLTEDLDLKQEGVIQDLSEFLLEWVSNHILYTDAKYVSVLKNRKKVFE